MSVLDERGAGILLAVSSLPSRYGIGAFGDEARNWLQFLNDAGQKYWQILPLNPTGWGDSPYQSYSSFAISPYYIDLDLLIGQDLLKANEVNAVSWCKNVSLVNYAALYRYRETLLRMAHSRFVSQGKEEASETFASFCSKNSFWLDNYCLFASLKKMLGGISWTSWDLRPKMRETAFIKNIEQQLSDDIHFYQFVQYTAFTQWQEIKIYAQKLGIRIIGDMPIYAAADSVDAWAQKELFLLNEDGNPLKVAGCPPDPFSATGQLWGNPLYNWEKLAGTNYQWWIDRLRFGFTLYDVMRIDHFRGFESFYSIDSSSENAVNGEWVKGPGMDFFNAVNSTMPGSTIIAEDLGFLTPEVKALVKASGYPGMKIVQFAFDSRESSDYKPYAYEPNSVVYTGTHDNPTALGWFKTASPEDLALAMHYLGISKAKDGCWAFIRCALSSAANTAIIPMQDYLCLDNRARMNIPSTLGGRNWRWRMLPNAASPILAEKIRLLTKIYGR